MQYDFRLDETALTDACRPHGYFPTRYAEHQARRRSVCGRRGEQVE